MLLAAGKAAAALGKTFQAEGETEGEEVVRPISNFFSVFQYYLICCLYYSLQGGLRTAFSRSDAQHLFLKLSNLVGFLKIAPGALFSMVCVIRKRIYVFYLCSCFDNALLSFALTSASCC